MPPKKGYDPFANVRNTVNYDRYAGSGVPDEIEVPVYTQADTVEFQRNVIRITGVDPFLQTTTSATEDAIRRGRRLAEQAALDDLTPEQRRDRALVYQTAASRNRNPENTLFEHGTWNPPLLLADMRNLRVMKDYTYLLPPNFYAVLQKSLIYQNINQTYPQERVKDETHFRTMLAWITWSNQSAGLNLYKYSPMDDYLIATFNTIESSSEQETVVNAPWDDTKKIDMGTFHEEVTDRLRFHMVLIPKIKTELPKFKNVALLRADIFNPKDQCSTIQMALAAHFFSLE